MPGAATPADREHMRRALALAERGWGRVHPNPLVGAVVVREDVVVGEGWHGEWGGPHAEVVALAAAGESARGATLYVTLEPCCHQGKTPACTLAIQRAGIARVVYGPEDPNPAAAGGAAQLRDAGLQVVGGVERDAVRAQNAAFFHVTETATPFLALKLALSLDARIAEAPGRRSALSGEAAWEEVHRLRAGFDAILVGSGTALVDDPLLTARGSVRPRRPPLRVVLDTGARLPDTSRLATTTDEGPVWVGHGPDAPRERLHRLAAAGVELVELPRLPEGGLDIAALLDRLHAAERTSILCEGGGRLGTALLAADLVQRLYLVYAPRLLGRAAVPAFPDVRPAATSTRWRVSGVRRLPPDVLVVLDRSR